MRLKDHIAYLQILFYRQHQYFIFIKKCSKKSLIIVHSTQAICLTAIVIILILSFPEVTHSKNSCHPTLGHFIRSSPYLQGQQVQPEDQQQNLDSQGQQLTIQTQSNIEPQSKVNAQIKGKLDYTLQFVRSLQNKIERHPHSINISQLTPREMVQQQIAQVFVSFGPGTVYLQQQSDVEMFAVNYKTIIQGVFVKSLRHLCHLLSQMSNSQVKMFHWTHYRHAPLMHCRTWMTEQQLKIFFKVVEQACKIKQQNLTFDQCRHLYETFELKFRQVVQKELQTKGRSTRKLRQLPGNRSGIEKGYIYDAQGYVVAQPKSYAIYEIKITNLFLSLQDVDQVYARLSSLHPKVKWSKDKIVLCLNQRAKKGLIKTIQRWTWFEKIVRNHQKLALEESDINKIVDEGSWQLKIMLLGMAPEARKSYQYVHKIITKVRTFVENSRDAMKNKKFKS